MKFKNQEAEEKWNKGLEKNSDPYGNAVFVYAKSWAELMEESIDKGNEIQDIAKELSHKADTDGITGFMYGAAVATLAGCWKYGEELREWHNLDAQIGSEGEEANKKGTTLNPALLSIK